MTTLASPTPAPGTRAPSTTGAAGPSGSRPGIRAILSTALPVLLMDVLAPLAVYQVLTRTGTPEVIALMWSALPAVCSVALGIVRSRRLNGVGVFVLASIVVGIGTALLDGDPHLAVARDAGPNVLVAVLLAGSLLIGKRPLLFHVARTLGETYQPDLRERMAQWWTDELFRRTLRRTTAVVAALLAGESALRLVLGQVLPVGVAMPVLQVESIVLWLGIVVLLRRVIVGAARRAAARIDAAG